MGLDDDEATEDQTRTGRQEMLEAALGSLSGPDTEAATALRREFSALLGRIDGSDGLSSEARQADAALRSRARNAARERLSQLRLTGAIGGATYLQLEAELDMFELDAEIRSRW